MNSPAKALPVAVVGLALALAGCSEKPRFHPVNDDRLNIASVCSDAQVASSSSCRITLANYTVELSECVPLAPPAPVSSVAELANVCPAIASKLSNTPATEATTTSASAAHSEDSKTSFATYAGGTVVSLGLAVLAFIVIRRRRDQNGQKASLHAVRDLGYHREDA